MRYIDLLTDGQSGSGGHVLLVDEEHPTPSDDYSDMLNIPESILEKEDDGDFSELIQWVEDQCKAHSVSLIRDASLGEDPMPLEKWLDQVKEF